MVELIKFRSHMYNFLARAYRTEVDDKFISEIKSADFLNKKGVLYYNGWHMIDDYIAINRSELLLELARDYARSFTGAGLPRNTAAFPYESVYTSKDNLMEQDAMDEVLKLYAGEGLVKNRDLVEPADHISFEFEFMNHLCVKMLDAFKINKKNTFLDLLDKQGKFLDQHIMQWVPRFCFILEDVAHTSFYKGLAVVTSGFIMEDVANIKLFENLLDIKSNK